MGGTAPTAQATQPLDGPNERRSRKRARGPGPRRSALPFRPGWGGLILALAAAAVQGACRPGPPPRAEPAPPVPESAGPAGMAASASPSSATSPPENPEPPPAGSQAEAIPVDRKPRPPSSPEAGSKSEATPSSSVEGSAGPNMGPKEAPAALAPTPSMDSEPDPRPLPSRPPPPERVLVLGDSMIVTELGRDLARQFEEHFGSQVTRRGKSSTGLARPDFFDWFEEGRRWAEATDPQLVVVIVGGNDGQDLVDAQGQGRVRWRSEDWASRYGERVHQFLDGMAAPGRKFVWVELPAMELRGLENKLKLIRRVQREALDTRSDVLAQLGHKPCYYDGNGQIRTEVPTGRARGRPIRQEDGIHLTLAGARFLSRCLFPHLLPEFSEADPRGSSGDDPTGGPVSSRAGPPEPQATPIQP